MAVYAVGDVQGCHQPLLSVLRQAGFDRQRDRLWLVGDLVNRGPESLEVLRFVRSLGARAVAVLGNHELHLLAVAEGARRLRSSDTVAPILAAPDRDELLDWLRALPLLHVDRAVGYSMVHAGIPPHWDLAVALEHAEEAQAALRARGYAQLVASGPQPLELEPGLSPEARLRVIVSYFTSMRVCTASGRLDLAFKGTPDRTPAGYLPWFAHPRRGTRAERIVFGHWAALDGRVSEPNVFALDTGCAWGRALTLMRLDDGQRFSCSCLNQRPGNESGSIRGQP